ncbi:hypothetical protein BpHYR1_046540 [Brachionus plicatilis]|uniref:Uncharacterized protein n=1 Tax=Brachionus plicatilis TaxID=10195 RepID=A0A3M7RF06_BRAPC|nr:hypothetical protein BpHYR1_046540 [Brachionus plicatilis]
MVQNLRDKGSISISKTRFLFLVLIIHQIVLGIYLGLQTKNIEKLNEKSQKLGPCRLCDQMLTKKCYLRSHVQNVIIHKTGEKQLFPLHGSPKRLDPKYKIHFLKTKSQKISKNPNDSENDAEDCEPTSKK